MTYNYSGNRLSSIVKGGTTYTYAHDSNGNVTTDGIRGMTITYNYLNLPKSVVKGADNLEFIYDATGVKLATKQNGTTQNYYTGAVVYKSDKTPDYILTSSGMIRKDGTEYIRQYNITDHLENVRSVVNQSGTVEQATDYYPYGLSFSNNNLTKNRYLYNGKEIQNQTLSSQFFGMYDYGARYYDPVIGRWMGVDPMAEKYFFLSPWSYVVNNPMNAIDPDGRDVWKINSLGKIVNRIKDKNQDAFYVVDKNGNRRFTTDEEGNKHYNSISFEYGTITNFEKSGWFSSTTRFAVNSESSGADLFKFFADNTKIEYGLINTQSNGSIVMTNNNESSVRASETAKKLSDRGQTVTSVVHNHPNNSNPSGFRKGDKSGDKYASTLLSNSHGYQVERYVYQPRTGNLIAYDEKILLALCLGDWFSDRQQHENIPLML